MLAGVRVQYEEFRLRRVVIGLVEGRVAYLGGQRITRIRRSGDGGHEIVAGESVQIVFEVGDHRHIGVAEVAEFHFRLNGEIGRLAPFRLEPFQGAFYSFPRIQHRFGDGFFIGGQI